MFGDSVVDTRRGVSIHSHDVEEARELGSRLFYAHSVSVLGPEAQFGMHIEAAKLCSMTVGWLWWGTGVEVGTAELDDSYQVNIPLRGTLNTSSGPERMVATSSRAAVYRHDRPTVMRGWSDGHDRVLAVKIDRAAAEQHLASMLNLPAVEPIRFDFALNLVDPISAQWVSLLRDLALQLRQPSEICLHPMMAQSLSASVMTGLMLAARHNYSDDLYAETGCPQAPTIQRAVDYIEEHLGEPIHVTAIAAHVHLSVRALQEGFQSAMGTTPMSYVRQARLRRARFDLHTAAEHENVALIAHRWGFTHLGRFASLYRKAFGESPSAALLSRRSQETGRQFRIVTDGSSAMLKHGPI
ncbi:AraC family transcriptional regulator [Mycolicibacterium neoaurum]|uniref:AraC family transcriptional regulator n=1 Tax=Mycolicibacterium neoaurum TaxID=1795 RepID=UPI001BD09485|nr:AraC family transcriptional regulator [Mycolicibacterium neoaurum]QVI27246.1 AraC family transcriptional regulator [Mycolicibacterium neoaurum]